MRFATACLVLVSPYMVFLAKVLHLACRDTLQHNQRLFCLVHFLTLTEVKHILKVNSHLIKGGWSAEAEEAAASLFEEAKGENKIK